MNYEFTWMWEDRRGYENGTYTLLWTEERLKDALKDRKDRSRIMCVQKLPDSYWDGLLEAVEGEKRRLGLSVFPKITGDSPEEVYLKAVVLEESLPPGWKDVMPVPERDDDG